MKVLCIKDGTWKSIYTNHSIIGPKYGEIVTASPCAKDETAYSIAEYQHNKEGMRQYFSKRRFIPLSSIDETEMQRNYQTEKTTV